MKDTNTPWELGELIILALDGSISHEQFAVLNERLKNDAAAREYYREFITTCIALRSGVAAGGQPGETATEALDPKLWGALAEDESHAPGVAVEHPKQEPVAEEQPNIVLRRPSRLPIYAAAVAASILILLLGYLYVRPFYEPATSFVKLVAVSGAKWATSLATKPGSELPASELKLLEGSATIEVRKGAEITLEGGTELTIESNREVYLASGTVTSSITANDGLGFVVRTPNAIITDYGTEFIVTILPDGRTKVTVLKGVVELVALTGQTEAQPGQMLSAGQSGEVDTQGDMVTSASSEADPLAAFVVKVKPEPEQTSVPEKSSSAPKFLDLVDILGGGDGFGTGRIGVSISLADGTIKDGFMFREDTASSGAYLACPAPIVDGVFVPGAARDGCVISTTGIVFKEFHPTSGSYNSDIFNSSQVIDQGGNPVKLHLAGRSWSPAPSLYMHSNSGITFDLDEIRQKNSVDITMFSCRCGMAFYDGQPEEAGWVNMYVLVDGKKRFETSTTSASDEPEDVRIRISGKDRFLTLVVTDGSDGKLINDNFLFIKPTIHIRQSRVK